MILKWKEMRKIRDTFADCFGNIDFVKKINPIISLQIFSAIKYIFWYSSLTPWLRWVTKKNHSSPLILPIFYIKISQIIKLNKYEILFIVATYITGSSEIIHTPFWAYAAGLTLIAMIPFSLRSQLMMIIGIEGKSIGESWFRLSWTLQHLFSHHWGPWRCKHSSTPKKTCSTITNLRI